MQTQEVIELLKRERTKRKISRAELAQLAGWANESAVRNLERPDSNPTLRSIQRYAEALGISLRIGVNSTHYLTFFNHAGGVGKTSSVRDIGYTLATLGFKVLLIDCDPQANLTSWLGLRQGIRLEQTIYSALLGDGDPTLPTPISVHGMDVIPSHLDLALIEPQLVGIIMGVTLLRSAVRRAIGYDFVLLDPPPSLGQLSASAVIAADHLVVPVPTNYKGMEGIRTVVKMVQTYRKAAPELSIALFLLTQFDERTRHDKTSAETMREQLSGIARVSTPLSHRPAIYKDATMEALPVGAFAQDGKAAEEVRIVTSELLETLGVRIDVS